MGHRPAPWPDSPRTRRATAECTHRPFLPILCKRDLFQNRHKESMFALPIERVDRIPRQCRSEPFEAVRMLGETENSLENRRGILQIGLFIESIRVFHRPLEEFLQTGATEIPDGRIATRDHAILFNGKRVKQVKTHCPLQTRKVSSIIAVSRWSSFEVFVNQWII